MELYSSKIKKFPTFREMELSGSNVKKFLIFSQKNAFLIFKESELSYISGNGNPKKLLIFQEVTVHARKMKRTTIKKFLIFQEKELSNPKLKKNLILQITLGRCTHLEKRFYTFSKIRFFSPFGMAAD